MRTFESFREKRINLNEQTFSDRQRSDMKKLLNKNFGTKEISKKTAATEKQLAKDNKKMFETDDEVGITFNMIKKEIQRLENAFDDNK